MVLFLNILLSLSISWAATLQEGWHKVTVGGQHAGFTVLRYEFDAKAKNFSATTYLKTTALGGDIAESLKAKSSEALAPISYSYTTTVAGKPKLIDATFKSGKMTATVTENGQVRKIEKNLPKGTFLSSFLLYLMLNNKSGLQAGNNFEYYAIAEEDAEIYKGTAFVKELTTYQNQEAFKILNTFNKIQFVSYVTPKGQILGTKSPASGIATELSPGQEVATAGIGMDAKSLKFLFGELPGPGLQPPAPKGPPVEKVKTQEK